MVECVWVTTTGVGDAVPGRKVIGVGTPLGTLVAYGVSVKVDVTVGWGGMGVLVGVSTGVGVAVGSGVTLGVRLGVGLAVEVALWEGVLGGNVSGKTIVLSSDEL